MQPKNQSINLTEAIAYSFRKQNVLNLVVIPLLPLATLILIYSNQSEQDQNLINYGLIAIFLTWIGYGWNLIWQLKKSGCNTTAPAWTLEGLFSSAFNGIKIVIAFLPFILCMCFPYSLSILPLPQSPNAPPTIEGAKDLYLDENGKFAGSVGILNGEPEREREDAQREIDYREGKTSNPFFEYTEGNPEDVQQKTAPNLEKLGILYHQLGDYNKAISLYDEALAKRESSISTISLRGDAYNQSDNQINALSDYFHAYSVGKLKADYLRTKFQRVAKSLVLFHVLLAAAITTFLFPFYLSCLYQASEKRSFFHLFRISKTIQVTRFCYRKLLLVSFVSLGYVTLLLYTGFTVTEAPACYLAPFTVPIAMTIIIHSTAQVFDKSMKDPITSVESNK